MARDALVQHRQFRVMRATCQRVHDTLGGLRIIETMRELAGGVHVSPAPNASQRVRMLLVRLQRPRAGAWGSEDHPPIASLTPCHMCNGKGFPAGGDDGMLPVIRFVSGWYGLESS